MSGNIKQPYVRFFPSDWLAGTRGMTASETGVYITLIALMYERCEPLPDDPKRLARQCGTSQSAFKKIVKTLLSDGKIEMTETGLWNKRVAKEFNFREEKSQKASDAATKRWSEQSGKDEQKQQANGADASAKQCSTDASARVIPYSRVQKDKKEKNNKKESPKSELEKVLDPERARAVVDHRQRIRKPLTAHSAKLLANRIAKCHNPNDAADMMLERGWTSVDQSWLDSIKTNGSGKQTIADAIEEVRRELIDEENKAERFGGCGAEPIVALPEPKAR